MAAYLLTRLASRNWVREEGERTRTGSTSSETYACVYCYVLLAEGKKGLRGGDSVESFSIGAKW